MIFLVNPGNDTKNPALIALINVDLTENPKNAWWSYAKSFFVVSNRMMALHVCRMDLVGQLLSRLIINIPFELLQGST